MENEWKHVLTGGGSDTKLFGVNIFDYEWKDTGKRVFVYDPLYNQPFNFRIYNIRIGNNVHEFVAGEFSNSTWGFYLNKK